MRSRVVVSLALVWVSFGCWASYADEGDAEDSAVPDEVAGDDAPCDPDARRDHGGPYGGDASTACRDPGCANRTVVLSGGCEDLSTYVEPFGDDTPLHVVGVRDSPRSATCTGYLLFCDIDVYIECTHRPVILALTSWEPMDWVLHISPGATIERIIVTSWVDWAVPTVSGADGIPVEVVTGGQPIVYNWSMVDGCDEREMAEVQETIAGLEEIARVPLTTGMGCYVGTEFRLSHACE